MIISTPISTNYGKNEPICRCMYLANLDPSFSLNNF